MFNITCRGDHPLAGRLVGNDPCGHASQLIENYEKVLALMLASANITLSDMLSDERRPTAEAPQRVDRLQVDAGSPGRVVEAWSMC